ncbi:P-II family nitrogen regulator [Marispirochaeta sp.]|jgi:nitrogen regulatory protein PII 2|uniref:P-II family nitrogen regulator n=1 Tax=Marispirochaeta sp. TaxID=2038653 RepID=UPI0029C6C7DF|nr:P-II family nitrogen regulator [Marispirochaeta sp.]
MKEVMAVIRMNMMNKTKEALSNAGFSSFTATGRVLGRGKGLVDYRMMKGAEEGVPEALASLGEGPRMIPKRIITLVVPEEKARLAADTIISVNKTGKPGDGKIFILPVLDAMRVRTGETGLKIL